MGTRRQRTKKAEPTNGLGERKELVSNDAFLSSGCTILDLAISDKLPGGFPAGRISHIYGLESSAKTVFMTEPLGAAQRLGGCAFYMDAERSCDFERLPLFGVDCGKDPLKMKKNWWYRIPTSIENLFGSWLQVAMDGCDPKKPNAMGIDSLSALPSEKEIDTDMKDDTYGTSRAKQVSLAFRKYLSKMAAANLAMIFVDQSRDNVGSTFGPSEVVSGGKALKFYSSVRIHMAFSGRIRAREKGPVIGAKFKFQIVKNKVAAPFREGEVYLLFDYGIDDIRTNLEWLKTTGEGADRATLRCIDCGHAFEVGRLIKTAGKTCPKCNGKMRKVRRSGGYSFLGEQFNSIDSAISWVELSEKEKELQGVVEERWREIHATAERAPKRR